jgi:hypothetical protein
MSAPNVILHVILTGYDDRHVIKENIALIMPQRSLRASLNLLILW